jgi:hypothetical protein
MEKPISLTLGTGLGLLALAGIIQKRKHLFGVMNVDTTHSIIRTPLASLLLWGARGNLKTTRRILFGTGLFYILIGIIGTQDKKVAGLLPSKLTRFDIVYHFAVGAAAIWLGTRRGRMMKP